MKTWPGLAYTVSQRPDPGLPHFMSSADVTGSSIKPAAASA
jgi:hypothetical protein